MRHLAAAPYFSDVSFTVGRGEIVGLAGLVGAGRSSVGLALFGQAGVDAARAVGVHGVEEGSNLVLGLRHQGRILATDEHG